MENSICSICGKTINVSPVQDPGYAFSGWPNVTLKDGNMVCSDCAEKVRILYPLRSSKRFMESETRFGSSFIHGKSVTGKGWLNVLTDPLEELTLEEFKQAQIDAEKAAQDMAARLPGAKAAAEADFTYRHHVKSGGTDIKPHYSDKKEYVVCVKVLYGEICPGDVVSVSHRDREYTAKVEEVWFWNYLDSPQRAIDKAFAGTTAALWFHQDVPFIYPGDILVVKES
ncbi:MAG: hypothetical protein IJG63_06095 [Oscillospiraceae bacterium]|nr:hypothetical protein [Oscillospiraceae bacterium]